MASADPLDQERSDERPKSAYLSKRDLKVMAIVLLVLIVMLYPVYIWMKRNAEKYGCGLNIKALADSAILYAQANDDRLPPVSDDNGAPSIRDGLLHCWATIPNIRGGIETSRNLRCPSAEDDEAVQVAAGSHNTEPLTYGMYMPLGTVPLSSIENPGLSLMIAETSNFGAARTYDPVPFKDASGKPIPSDGYAIAWDSSNDFPTEKTRSVTRLAFYETDKGEFEEKGPARHQGGIFFMNVEGHRSFLDPTYAKVFMQQSTNRPRAPWAVPYSYTAPER